VQRNFDGTLEKKNSDGNGSRRDPERCNPGLQAVAEKFDSAKNQREFNSFARTMRNTKRRMPQPAAAPARSAYASIFCSISAKMARNAIHPDNHRNNEDGATSRSSPSKAVFAYAPVFERNRDGEAERGGQADAKPDESRKMRPGGPGEIHKDDATTRELDAFTKGD